MVSSAVVWVWFWRAFHPTRLETFLFTNRRETFCPNPPGCGGWTIFILKLGLKIILSTNHQLRIARFSPPWTHLYLCPLHLPCWRTHSCPDSKSPRESGRPDAEIESSGGKLSTQHFQSAPGLWHFYRFRIPMSLHFSLWFSGNMFNSFALFHLKCATKSGKSTGAFCCGSQSKI